MQLLQAVLLLPLLPRLLVVPLPLPRCPRW